MKNFKVYIHVNKINDKVYIGQTCQNLEKRFNSGKGYINCPHFYAAIQKYGWDSFEHKILKVNLSSEEANFWEKYYISLYESQDPNKGYNILPGGNDNLKKYWEKEENRKKQSINKKQYLQKHPEILKKMVASSHTIEHNKKHSAIMKNGYETSYFKILNESRKKKIQCIETQENFDSLTAASKAYGIPCGNISKVLKGERKTAGGYHWSLIKESMS